MSSSKPTGKPPSTLMKRKEKNYEIRFPIPKGIPVIWFDQFSMEEESRTHLIVKLGCSLIDSVYVFALSKSELKTQNFNLGPYVEVLRPAVNQEYVTAAKVKRITSTQATSHPIPSIRYVRAGRVNDDGEFVLYTFSTVALLDKAKVGHKDGDTPQATEAEPVVVLHSDLNVHLALVLELLPHTKEGL